MFPSKLRLTSPVDTFGPQLLLNQKGKGEWAEIAFLAKATSLGYTVCKPYGDNKRYDFIVEAGGRTTRVQVKSGWTEFKGGYPVAIEPVGGRYKRNEIDAIVAYVAPENAWYVMPAEKVRRRRTATLYPQASRSRGTFEQYRDAWELLGTTSRRAGCEKVLKGKSLSRRQEELRRRARQARTAWELLGAALFSA